MNARHLSRGIRHRIVSTLLVIAGAIAFASVAVTQEPRTGKVQQGLVAGTEVSNDVQQKMGLVTLSSGCSGSLLRSNWILTAAHCVDDENAAMPGTYTNRQANTITITFSGTGLTPEVRTAAEIITFRPNDVAIVRVQVPFNTHDFDNREIYQGKTKGLRVRVLGRGINQFAQNGNPVQQDGKYREGVFDVDAADDTTYSYPSKNGVSVAGGDSGGPAFVKGEGSADFDPVDLIVGVTSNCQIQCTPGKMCGKAAAPNNWTWVTATPRCTDAAVGPVWNQIVKRLEPPHQYDAGFTPTSVMSEMLYSVRRDGSLWWQRDDIGFSASGVAAHKFTNALKISEGWDTPVDILPGGGGTIYVLRRNGDLDWYRHQGYQDGEAKWAGPITVGTGWNACKQIIPMGDGVLYCIRPDGSLQWNKHNNYQDGQGGYGGWAQPAKTVSSGHWDQYKLVFAGGNGVFYVVLNDGRVFWYRHNAYRDAIAMPAVLGRPGGEAWAQTWEGPKEIGHGWSGIAKAFSTGYGHIYGLYPNGEFYAYIHAGWEDGSAKWGNWSRINGNWQDYLFVFATMPSHAAGDDMIIR
jgi:hypothetical protein